jgi:hypothetical protein
MCALAVVGYNDGMARRADDFGSDSSIEVVNPDTDRSLEALAAWIAELEREDDWIDLPTTAAELIAEDRAAHGT